MDIDRLRYFCTIAKAGSLTAAAEILHVSQPALSKAIKTLESELNAKLFVPRGRGISITEAGKEIALKAESILTELHHLKSLPSKPSKDIRFATFEVFSTYFLSKVLSEKFPDDTASIFETLPGEMEQVIASGKADIGITYLPIAHPDIEFIEVGKIKMGVFGLKSVFGNIEFPQLPFMVPIFPTHGSPSKVEGLDGWPDHEVPRFIKYRVSMMESALGLCRKGMGVSYIPNFIAELHNDSVAPKYKLVSLDMPRRSKAPRQSVFICKRQNETESSVFKKIATELRRLK